MKQTLQKLLTVIVCTLFSCLTFWGVVRVKAENKLFDIQEMLLPFWEGEITYNETITPVREKDGSILPIDLLYPIDEIIEVRSADLLLKYEEGKDYSVGNGKFVINPSGGIKTLAYDEFHPAEGQAGFEARNGGYVLWKEGSWYHQRQTVITYRHKAGYGGYVAEGKGRLLANTLEKLASGKDINLLVYGDSISTGANSSGHKDIHVSPYMPTYPELFAAGIEAKYGVKVKLFNASVGGTDSAWGLSNLRGGILNVYDEIDLAVVAFGMNDTARDAESFAVNASRIAKGLKTKYKDIDVLLVGTMLPNYDAYKFYGHQTEFYDALTRYEKQGVAAVNIGGVHKGLLQIKNYADMTGNNVNHANDYLARIYAQTLLKTLEVSDYDVKEEETSAEVSPESEVSAVEESTAESKNKSCGGNASAPFACAAAILAAAFIKNKKIKQEDKS